MKLEFQMVSEFGEFLADGHLGNQFRALQIESIWDRVESIVFDFTGVTNLTDSFVHAYFGNMAEEHGRSSRGRSVSRDARLWSGRSCPSQSRKV